MVRLTRWRTLSRDKKERAHLNVYRILPEILGTFCTTEIMKITRFESWAEMARAGVSFVRSVGSSVELDIGECMLVVPPLL